MSDEFDACPDPDCLQFGVHRHGVHGRRVQGRPLLESPTATERALLALDVNAIAHPAYVEIQRFAEYLGREFGVNANENVRRLRVSVRAVVKDMKARAMAQDVDRAVIERVNELIRRYRSASEGIAPSAERSMLLFAADQMQCALEGREFAALAREPRT